jgi:hypothetical protein
VARHFIVEVREVWTNHVKVEADSPEEALKKVEAGVKDGELEYSHTLDTVDWTMGEYDEGYKDQLDWYETDQVLNGLKK